MEALFFSQGSIVLGDGFIEMRENLDARGVVRDERLEVTIAKLVSSEDESSATV